MATPDGETGFFLEGLFTDGRFQPGLRPRAHLAPSRIEPIADDDLVGVEDPEEVADQLAEMARDVRIRNQEGESDGGCDERTPQVGEGPPGSHGPEAQRPEAETVEAGAESPGRPGAVLAGVRRPGDLREQLGDVRVLSLGVRAVRTSGDRRLEDARRTVEPLAPSNVHQGELKAILIVMLDHMESLCRRPDGATVLERWWPVLETYQRFLLSPEMATRRARTLVTGLLCLEPEKLTERRLWLLLGN